MSALTFSARPLPAPVPPVPGCYYIMGACSLPNGTAFIVGDSQRHLLTEFAMGSLSVAEVVDFLAAQSPALPLAPG